MILISLLRRWQWRLRGLLYVTPAALSVAAACLIVFLVQRGASRVEFVYGYSFGQALVPCFGLSWPLFSHGFYWQPVTYMFLHAGWAHLLLNMSVVLFFGPALEADIGGRGFWRVFLTGGVAGGLGWMGMTALTPFLPSAEVLTLWTRALPEAFRVWLPTSGTTAALDTAMCVGASGGVFALIGAYAALFPRRIVYLIFPIPARLSARALVLLLVVLDLAAVLFLRVQVAYAAHLAGCLAGVLYGWRLKRADVFGF